MGVGGTLIFGICMAAGGYVLAVFTWESHVRPFFASIAAAFKNL